MVNQVMNIRKSFFDLIRAGPVAAFLLTSCSTFAISPAPVAPTASPQPVTPTATETTLPSATATPLPSATASPTPTLTPTITPTPVTVAQVSPGWNAYCRMGPGSYYFAITFLQAGNFYLIVGRDGLGNWWQVQVTPTVQCWEGDPTSLVEGPVEQAPILPAPPLPAPPTAFEDTSHCDSGNNTMTVWLTWGTANGVNGYHIYRNGEAIAKLGPNATSYTDDAPRGVNLKYQIEAFNDYGVSPSLSLKIDACI